MKSVADRPVAVLFVCMGNICRSPTAEGLMRKRLVEAGLAHRFTIDSAGTHGYHAGSPPDSRAIDAAAARGVQLAELRARQIQREDFDRFDYVLLMDDENRKAVDLIGAGEGRATVELLLNFSERFRGAAVPDPYYGGNDGFERVLDMLDDGIAGFIRSQISPAPD